MNEQEKQDRFIELIGGIRRADRLQMIWNNSYPVSTLYGQITKEEIFKRNAIKEGYTKKEIEAFLNL